jgi:hypothetical protein
LSGGQWDGENVHNGPPGHYGDTDGEYQAASHCAALRDASHWTRLHISGADHLDFLHRMSTSHFNNMEAGQGREAVFTENRGRILDLCTFYCGENRSLAVFSPSSRELIPAWLDRFIFTEAIELRDLTDDTAMFELIGPQASALVQQVIGVDLQTLPAHQLLIKEAKDDLWLATMPWGNNPGLRVAGPPEALAMLWKKLSDAGATPMGERVWEILRIERGLPIYGSELNENYNPWEAGLGRTIDMDKGCYIGQEVIARLDTYDKVKQHLVGLYLRTGELPAPGTILHVEGRAVGILTSRAQSPTLGPIALAYVRRAHAEIGTALTLAESEREARVAPLPFSRP